MMADAGIYLGKGDNAEFLYLSMANRHGLITGATGTGKTVTLQIMAEAFSKQGIPVFAADIKGDLSGISQAGHADANLQARATQIGLKPYTLEATPTMFWDVFGEQGHPIRTTITDMGPLMISRLLGLSGAQEGALNIAFKIADKEGLALLDLKDLRALLHDLGSRGPSITTEYGNVTAATIGAIQRQLMVIETQGGEKFFGEPALDIKDFMRTTADGLGYVNIIAADKLVTSPLLYATFLLWLLSDLFQTLPEVGDTEKPKLVFFFDEAHLLFADAPPGLLQQIAQTVKLIRSKGIGIYFVTQNPLDIPDAVLAQLGNRVQHALRAYTPRDLKAVQVAASTFRPNPKFDTAKVISELAKGEALVSVLDPKGVPTMVDRTLIRPPSGQLGPVTPDQRRATIAASPVAGKYEGMVDRDSAYEKLASRASMAATEKTVIKVATTMARQVGYSVARQLGSALVRGVLGGLLRR
jgi:uncharacterized protein